MLHEYLFLITLSFGITLLIGSPLIHLLKALGSNQAIREDGPKSHLEKKSNVPTMGGIIFLIPAFLLTLAICFIKKDCQTLDLIVVMAVTLVMAILGFTDDYLKIKKQHNKGVSGWIKLLIQFLVSLIIVYLYNEGDLLIYLIWVFFIIAGAANSYNLTDGLDGLVTSVSLASFLGCLFLFNQYNEVALSYLVSIFFGSLLGFLCFNKYPAKVFMGDTGSLAIGGAIGAIAVVSRSELFLICFATIPIIEALSVIIQVVSYQLSKKFLGAGKRIFKMAPLHHHFELCNWKETDIVKRFVIFQIACVIVGILFLSLQ